jgi:Phage terminase large subunit (GpA)
MSSNSPALSSNLDERVEIKGKLYTKEEVEAAYENAPSLWVLKNKIRNEVGRPIDFTKRKFLEDIYDDLSPFQVLEKPPQIGATVMFTLKSFWVALKQKRQIIYTLPTSTDITDMVGGAINRIIAQNPPLMRLVRDHDTIEQKLVGQAMIFYRGTFTAKQAMMVPSGLNIHDEVDASDPQVITQYENRLQAQEDGGWRWYFSHPSLSGHGVDIYMQKADQKEWHITCDNGHEEFMEWPTSVDITKEIYVCKLCKTELTDDQRINGRWINKDGIPWSGQIEGGYEFSGWHVNQMMLWNKSAKDIIKAYNDPQKDKQYFYNYVLGLPYIGSEDRIEPSVVLRNCTDTPNDYYDPNDRVIIGADTSHGINYVMMNTQGVFFYDRAEEITATKDPYDAIRKHMNTFANSVAIFDQGGDLIGVRKLQQEYPGRVFLCYYRKDRKSVDFVEWGVDDEFGKVMVDRNRHITLIVEQLRDVGRIRLNGTKEEWADFASQFGNIYRELLTVKATPEKDDKTLYGNEYVWKRNGHDDYLHALGYAIIGMQRFQGQHVKIFGTRNAMDGIPRGQVVTDGGVQLLWPK